jgi:Tfp pilus assembly protein PilV
MAELFDTRYFSGQGKVFIGPRDAAGEPAGLVYMGDVSAVELSPNVEKETVIENVTGLSGVGAEWFTRVEYSLSMQMRSIKAEHLAQALHASNTAKASGSATDEVHTAYSGKFIQLANTKVSSIVVKDTSGTPTYVEGTDYIAHNDIGMVEIISGGGITDLDVLKISYSFAAQHIFSVKPANTDFALTFNGINRADNDKQVRCRLYKMKLSPATLDMIAQGATEMPITGTVLLDSLRAAGDQYYSWVTED